MNKTGTIPEPELENIYNFGMEDRTWKNKNFNPGPETYTLPSHVIFSYFR